VFPLATSVRSVRPPLVTLLLIAMNVWVFLGETHLRPEQLDAVVHLYGLVPLRQTVALRQAPGDLSLWLWPIFTSMFLHGGWAHIIGNMMFLWVFGAGLESRLGHARFLLFYLGAGVFAAQAQVASAPLSVAPMVGASGAIAGVIAGFVLLYPRARVFLMLLLVFIPVFFSLPVLVFAGLWFAEQLLNGVVAPLSGEAGRAGGVAWWAHIGGFLGGAALLPILLDRQHQGHRPPHYAAPQHLNRPY